MAATKPASASSTTPSSFSFLKEGLLLPGKSRRLFAAIFTILVAWITLLLVADELGIEPLKLEVGRDMDTLKSTADPGGPDYAHLLQQTLDDYQVLFLTCTAYLVSADITGSVIQLVSLFAAVTTYSGDDGGGVHTFGALVVGRAKQQKQQLKAAVLTVAFVCALKTAAVSLLLASTAVVAFLAFRWYFCCWCRGLFLAGCLVLLVAFAFYIFLSFVCSLAVVVALDESEASRCHGAGGAVGRARQLVKGRQRQEGAMLFVFVMTVLAAVVRLIYWQAKMCARSDMGLGALLLGVLYTVLMAALELFQDCALTAFYYECKGRPAQKSETEYVKLSIQDA